MSEGVQGKQNERLDLPSRDHVIVRSSDGVEISLILEYSRRTTPQHRDSTLWKVTNSSTTNVLFRSPVTKVPISNEQAFSLGLVLREKGG
jgi:hypothetical protein